MKDIATLNKGLRPICTKVSIIIYLFGHGESTVYSMAQGEEKLFH